MSLAASPATPSTLDGWTAAFRDAEIPVFAATADALELMRTNEDAVDANHLGETLARDPLMTLKVLRHAANHRHARVVTDVETVTAALVMMGIGPFFRAFGPQPTVEERLAANAPALQGLQAVHRRAERAASFALGFAVHRMDPDAAVIHSAALLHDFAEMLLWCLAPDAALKVQARLKAEPELRTHAAQQAVLGIELGDLEQALMRAWRLPELLKRMTDDRHADTPPVRTVSLAVRIARHSERDWHHPRLADDVVELAHLLNLAPTPALNLVRSLDPAD